MSLANNIKNEGIRKIFFIKLTYIDSITTTQKEVFFSDYFCEIPKNLISGDTLIPEIRIDSIPFFNKEVDVMENNTIIKSDISLKLMDKDKAFKDFFIDNFFTNQLCELYITTELDLSPFACSKIATVRISEVEIDDLIVLKFKEILTLETSNEDFMEFYDYTNMSTSLEKDYKQIISGKCDLLKLNNINEISDNYVDSTLTVNVIPSTNYVVVRCQSDLDAEKLRYMIKIGDYIKLPNATGIETGEYKYSTFATNNYRDFYFEGINLNSYTNQQMLIKNDDNYLFNNKYLVSKNKSTDRKSSNITSIYNNTISDSYVIPATNWDFIRAGDYIYLEHKTDTYIREYFYVSSYDIATNKVYLANDKMSAYVNATDFSINLDYINSIKIKLSSPDKAIDLKREAARYELQAPLYSEVIQTNTFAKYLNVVFNEVSNVKLSFTSTKTSIAGNNDSLIFENEFYRTFDPLYTRTINGSYDPILTTTTNNRGGNTNHILYWYDDTLVGTTVNQIKLLSIPSMTIASSGTLSNYVSSVSNGVEFYLNGGKSNGTFFILTNALGFTQAGELPFVNYAQAWAIYFDKGTSTLPTVLTGFTGLVIKITVLITDTRDDVALKVMNAINSYRSQFFGLYSFKKNATGDVIIKDFYINNANKSIYTTNINVSSTAGSYRSFYTTIENTDELILNIDRVGLALEVYSVKQSLVFDQVRILGTAGLNNAQKRALYLKENSNNSFDVGDLIVSQYACNEFYDATTVQYLIKVNSFQKAIQSFNDNKTEVICSDYFPWKTDLYNIPANILEIGTIGDVYVNYKDEYIALADNLTNLFNLYSITTFSSSDISTIRTNHKFDSFCVISDIKKLYEVINQFSESFNLISYVDNDGVIRLKFIDLTDNASTVSMDYSDLKSFRFYVSDFTNSKIIYNINKDNFNDISTQYVATDTFINSIASLTNFKKENEIDTIIINNFFANSFNSITYKDHFTKRYFKKIIKLEIICSIEYIDLNIFDNITIVNSSEIGTATYRIIKKETNFNDLRITAIKLI